jgi:hypothetical protein
MLHGTTLCICGAVCTSKKSQVGSKQYVPVDITIVFPASGVLFVELDASKGAFLSLYGTYELDDAVHCAGNVDGIADIDFLPVTAEHFVSCSRIGSSRQGVEGCLSRNGLAVGDTEIRVRRRVYVLQGK